MPDPSLIKNANVSSLKSSLIQPFRTALGEHKTLDNLLFSIELHDGTKGFGEAAIATHITGETIEKTWKNLEGAASDLVGRDASDYLNISCRLHERFSKNKSVIAAVECAVMDALTRQWKIPLWKFFGNAPQKLTTDITIVIAGLEETVESVRQFYRQGFRVFKVKIGRDAALDFKRVSALRRLAPDSKIYLDVNQGYSAKETLAFLKSLKKVDIEPSLVEQPVAKGDWEGLKKVSRETKIPVCADESVSSLSDAVKCIKERAASVINIKLMKSGIFEAREIALLAKANGIRLMIGGMMETSLAMTAAAHMAAGLGFFDYVDLDTPFFIQNGRRGNLFLSSRGIYDLNNVKAGVGITP